MILSSGVGKSNIIICHFPFEFLKWYDEAAFHRNLWHTVKELIRASEEIKKILKL